MAAGQADFNMRHIPDKAIAHNLPFVGRPVMLTFDDGYCDFAENAWPIIREHGLGAVVFPVTSKVGGVSDWDAHLDGGAAELMDWATLRRMADGSDIANSVEFLLSEKARNITGVTLTVDAGNTA